MAIALRVGVPIYVEEAVLAQAGLLIPDEGDEEASSAVREDEVEKFKEFWTACHPTTSRPPSTRRPVSDGKHHGCVSYHTRAMSTRLADINHESRLRPYFEDELMINGEHGSCRTAYAL